MSRKILALLISVTLIISLFSGVLTASAADEKLVFELDLSNWTDAGKAVSNAVSGNDSVINVIGSPTMGEVSGNKFLNFTGGGTAGIKVADEDFINQNELTVELWAKGTDFGETGSKSYRIFSMATGAGGDSTSVMDIFGYNGRIFHRPGGTGAIDRKYRQADFSAYDEKWAHFVLTRKWNPAAANDGTGTWSGDLYINGTKLTPAEEAGNKEAQAKRTETSAFIGIGNRASFDTGFYGAIARFKVYQSVLSDKAIADKYAEEKYDFIEYADTMEIESISAESGKISDAAGEIKVTFNNYIDTATLEDGIKFTKADDSQIKGGYCVVAEDEYTKEAKILYGKLENNEDYVLNITSALKSKNGKTFTGDRSFEYTAEASYIFFEDFEGDEYVVGENPPAHSNIIYTSTEVENDSSNHLVCETNGEKYISMSGGGEVTKNSRISVAFDTPIEDDTFVVDLKIRPYAKNDAPNNNTPRDIMIVSNGTSSLTLGSIRYGDVRTQVEYIGSGATATGGASFTKTDENGFYDVRTRFVKQANGMYTITFLNPNSEKDGSAVFVAKSIGSVKSIVLSHLYPLDAATATDVSADIARIAVYKETEPKVLFTDFEKLERSDNEIKVVFNDDINEDLLTDDTFVLLTPDGRAVNMEYKDYSDRVVTLKLNDFLEPSTEYTLKVGGIQSVSGFTFEGGEYKYASKHLNVIVDDVKLCNQSGAEIGNLNGITSFEASVDFVGTEEDTTCCVLLVLYDEDGRIIRIEKNNPADSLVKAGKKKTITTKVLDMSGIEKIKTIVWTEAEDKAELMLEKVIQQEEI